MRARHKRAGILTYFKPFRAARAGNAAENHIVFDSRQLTAQFDAVVYFFRFLRTSRTMTIVPTVMTAATVGTPQISAVSSPV